MQAFYDLHLHSCLSPCGADDMTPCNLVNMAALAGLQVIAVADHNTSKNVPAAAAAGERVGVLVVPAMELTCREDIHVLCLLPDLTALEDFRAYVYARLPRRQNRPQVFGDQLILDENDRVLGQEPQLLAFAADIGIYQVHALLETFGGLAVPAHIDRTSYSLIGVMGLVDPAMGFRVYEVTPGCDREALMETYRVQGGFLSNSDAHDLFAIPDACRTLTLPELTAPAVIQAVRDLGASGQKNARAPEGPRNSGGRKERPVSR